MKKTQEKKNQQIDKLSKARKKGFGEKLNKSFKIFNIVTKTQQFDTSRNATCRKLVDFVSLDI